MRRVALVAFLVATCVLPSARAYNCLFIGHSFFVPVARRLPALAAAAGLSHTQSEVFRGGEGGAPGALWNNVNARGQAQTILDAGDVEIFGMTVHQTNSEVADYQRWIDYALARNPNTAILLGLPWLPYPTLSPLYLSTADYANEYSATVQGVWQKLVSELQALYPGVTVISSPHGLGAVELRLLFDAGALASDVRAEMGPRATSLFTDTLGHGGEVTLDLTSLIMLKRIYPFVDLSTLRDSFQYTTDLTTIATDIVASLG